MLQERFISGVRGSPLGTTDWQIRMIERFAGYFTDYRAADLIEHTVPGLVGQRVFGIALGYEDLIDHDQLRHDPVMAVLGAMPHNMELGARVSDGRSPGRCALGWSCGTHQQPPRTR